MVKKIPFVFVLGRPGSGKSEFFTQSINILAKKNIFCKRLDDVRQLKAFARGEQGGAKYLVTDPRTGKFIIKDPDVFNMVLRQLDKEAKEQTKANTVLIVEFARSENVDAILQNFSPEVLDQALFVFLHSTVERSIERTKLRVQKQDRTVSQDHQVDESVITSFYATDDRDQFCLDDRFKERTVLIDNDNMDLDGYRQKIAAVIDRVLAGKLNDPEIVVQNRQLIDQLQAKEAASAQEREAEEKKMLDELKKH